MLRVSRAEHRLRTRAHRLNKDKCQSFYKLGYEMVEANFNQSVTEKKKVRMHAKPR